ncbi:MAG: hypothetical protein AAFZ65_10785 [Planctomycetota bacterium]
MDGQSVAFDFVRQGRGAFQAREVLRFLGPSGLPLRLSMPPVAARLRMHAVARRAGADWLHGLAVTERAEGGIDVLGFEHPAKLQILPTLDENRGVDVEGVEAAARWVLEGSDGAPAAQQRTEFERRLARAGVGFPRERRALERRTLERQALALLDGVQGVGSHSATEWRPRRDTVLEHDPAHTWLRPRLDFADPAASDSTEFCTTHPTPAEVGVLNLEREWSTSIRVGARRVRLRVGFLLHPLGWSVVLTEPRRADLVVVVCQRERLDWRLFDRDDYAEAFFGSRVAPIKDHVRCHPRDA